VEKREQRRYLTTKYQQKQIRLEIQYNRYTFYDPRRHLRTKRALKYRFYYDLAGEGVEVNRWEYDTYDEVFPKEKVGSFRKQSWKCPCRRYCRYCSNPRKSGYMKKADSLTRPEVVAEQQMIEDLKEYNTGGYDEEVYERDLSGND
jgi:hypothetical protein